MQGRDCAGSIAKRAWNRPSYHISKGPHHKQKEFPRGTVLYSTMEGRCLRTSMRYLSPPSVRRGKQESRLSAVSTAGNEHASGLSDNPFRTILLLNALPYLQLQ